MLFSATMRHLGDQTTSFGRCRFPGRLVKLDRTIGILDSRVIALMDGEGLGGGLWFWSVIGVVVVVLLAVVIGRMSKTTSGRSRPAREANC